MEREYNIIREKEYEMNKGSKNEFERIKGGKITRVRNISKVKKGKQ